MKLNQSLKYIPLLALALLTSCKESQPSLVMQVYGPKTLVNEDTVYHTIGDFALTNQYGETVTQENMKDKIVISNFFFATCQSICPEMSTNLTEVQELFAQDDSLLILSHSVNPLHDTVEVLMRYANTYGAIKNKWHLLTGDKKMIYDLAKSSYLVNALEDDGTPEGFLHSELLLLIDSQGRIRGMYDGTDKAEVEKLVSAVRLLKTER